MIGVGHARGSLAPLAIQVGKRFHGRPVSRSLKQTPTLRLRRQHLCLRREADDSVAGSAFLKTRWRQRQQHLARDHSNHRGLHRRREVVRILHSCRITATAKAVRFRWSPEGFPLARSLGGGWRKKGQHCHDNEDAAESNAGHCEGIPRSAGGLTVTVSVFILDHSAPPGGKIRGRTLVPWRKPHRTPRNRLIYR